MTRILYTVTATLPDEPTAREYTAWLEDGHVDAVIEHGAHSAMIVVLQREDSDGLPPGAARVQTQYVFSTRETFDRYIKHHAPALREEGLRRFGTDRGVTFSRTIGEII